MSTFFTVQKTKLLESKAWQHHNLWYAVNLACLLWLLRVVWLMAQAPAHNGPLFFTGGISQQLVLTTGYSALLLLCLSLSCTPLASLTGWNKIITVRKSLGLWSFALACLHALLFMGGTRFLTNRDAWPTIWHFVRHAWLQDTWGKVPFAWAGVLTLTLLLPLALTSNRWAMRQLGKNWKRLHRLVYLAVPIAVWHYWWRETYTLKMMNGDTNFYYVYAFIAIVALLLLLRLPVLRKVMRR